MTLALKNITKSKAVGIAGILLFLAGCVVFMGIITAEAYYPAVYTTTGNEISDLGATRPPGSIIYQPSAAIFNISMMATGILILLAVYLLQKSITKKAFMVTLGLFGVGVLGVGLFPGNTVPHAYFALLTFVFGGISAVISFYVITGPYRYVAVMLGAVALLALFFNGFLLGPLGAGGAERWVAYPTTLWMIGYGGYLFGQTAKIKSATTLKKERI